MSESLDPQLEARLAALASELTGADWPDVRRRARRRTPRRARGLALVAAALLGLTVAVPALGLDDRVRDLLGVTQTDEDVPAPVGDGAPTPVGEGAGPLPYVYGRWLHGFGAPRRLVAPLRPRFVGVGAAQAVPSPDGRDVAYHTADRTAAVLRVVDLRTGTDRLLARGAQLVAWGERGLAYFQADPPDYRERFTYAGRVVVRATPESPPVTWVDGLGRYTVVAWAGPRLVIQSEGCNLPVVGEPGPPAPSCRSALPPGPYVLDGPGRARPLDEQTVVAVSPDGRLGFGPLRQPTQDGPARAAHVTDLETGQIVDRLGVRTDAIAGFTTVGWAGDRIVTALGGGRLRVLRFRDGRLSLERTLRLPRDHFPGTFGPNFSSPVFADDAGTRVVVRASSEYRDTAEYRGITTFLTCDLPAQRCRSGRPLRERLSLGLVYNPSGPR